MTACGQPGLSTSRVFREPHLSINRIAHSDFGSRLAMTRSKAIERYGELAEVSVINPAGGSGHCLGIPTQS